MNLPSPPDSPARNTLGLVGFLFSLLGVLTCGVVAPVGLLLSLLALFRRPRGFATAGAVVGLLATLWLGAVGAALVGLTRLEPLAERFSAEFQQMQATLTAVSQASRDVVRHREQHGDWPDDKAGQELVGQYQDAYGTSLKYTRVAELVLIISSGADREFATPDDVSLDPQTMSDAPPGADLRLDLD